MNKKSAKTGTRLDYRVEEGGWGAEGGGVDVKAATLQALRTRARTAAHELYGERVEIKESLDIASSLMERVVRNNKKRAKVREARDELRRDTVEILDVLRRTLGASYED